jgi:hypothetical protein
MASAAGGLTAGLALEVSATRGSLAPAGALAPVAQPSATTNLNVNVDAGGVHSPGDPRVQKQNGTTVIDALRSKGYIRNRVLDPSFGA